MNVKDKAAIDNLTARFFAAFHSADDGPVDLDIIHHLFIEQGIIIKAVPPKIEFYTLGQFIEPRQELLNGGSLTRFSEEELAEHTHIFGNIAQRVCTYRKRGILNGVAFETDGLKTIQFVHTDLGWRMSSAAWDDEREGLSVPLGF